MRLGGPKSHHLGRNTCRSYRGKALPWYPTPGPEGGLRLKFNGQAGTTPPQGPPSSSGRAPQPFTRDPTREAEEGTQTTSGCDPEAKRSPQSAWARGHPCDVAPWSTTASNVPATRGKPLDTSIGCPHPGRSAAYRSL